MKVRKEVVGGIIVIALIAGAIGVINTLQKEGQRAVLAKRVAQVSGGIPSSVEELRKAIAVYETRMDHYIKDAVQAGTYWKILATRLQDQGLHQDALSALERGIAYNPEDPTLQYLAGVSAAMVAKSYLDIDGNTGGSDRYYALAEAAYLNAIKMDGQYGKPLYALGILYVFELNRPADAIPPLLRYMELRKNDVDGLFVLARAYVMNENYEEALDAYDQIIRTTNDKNRRSEAERNKQFVMDLYYG
ncbi:MAG: tetratricopeptide repeat protein [Treponema sp.]|jgi:tetratricopeptide (TPR) repeat protein|nr:tetratricopeptide repeat protein [Treponema sp.]